MRACSTSCRTPISRIPTVTLSGGKTVKLDQAAYGELRALPNRADREKVMSAFFGSLARSAGRSARR